MSVGKYSLSCDCIVPKTGNSFTITNAIVSPLIEHYSSTALQYGTECTLDVYGYKEGDVFHVTKWMMSPIYERENPFPRPAGMPAPLERLFLSYIGQTSADDYSPFYFFISTDGDTLLYPDRPDAQYTVYPSSFSYRFNTNV